MSKEFKSGDVVYGIISKIPFRVVEGPDCSGRYVVRNPAGNYRVIMGDLLGRKKRIVTGFVNVYSSKATGKYSALVLTPYPYKTRELADEADACGNPNRPRLACVEISVEVEE